jgi:NAD(P)-dependent dehydrogenase (short-subunit alcohol dehydrogenase family)
MDLTSLASVVAGAQRFLSLETALHGLVNNAGIMATPFMLTGDGHEAQWQTNYLAHWVLTAHLLPTLQRTAKAEGPGSVRVVNVSSSGHLAAPKGGICFAGPELKDEAGGSVWKRYGQSKLANILHARTLHAKYGPGSPGARDGEGEIWTSAVHPGIVESGLAGSAEQNTTGFSGVLWAMRKMGVTMEADKGAWTNLWCVAGKEMTAERSGGYEEVFNRCGEPGWMSGPAKDAKLAERLEEWTEESMTREGWVGKK